jgi:hypothetical protein
LTAENGQEDAIFSSLQIVIIVVSEREEIAMLQRAAAVSIDLVWIAKKKIGSLH